MKIAYFTDLFLPLLNGVTTALVNQAIGLARRGHEIYIITPRQKEDPNFEYENITVLLTDSFPFPFYPDVNFSAPISFKVFKAIRDFDPDIIHFQSPSAAGVAASVSSRLFQKPLLGTFHGYFMEPEYLKVIGVKDTVQKVTTNVLWKYTQLYFDQCDTIVSPARHSKQDLIDHGVTKDIHIIHNSMDKNIAKHVSETEIEELKYHLGLKKNVILYVGRLSLEKNIDQLVESFSIMLKDNPDTSLCIIGKGPAQKSLEEQVQNLGIQNNIVFAGEVNQEALLTKGYFEMADIFATASLSELQPMSIIEAYFFGIPAVGSAKRGTKEMIENVGLLSEPDDIQGFADNLSKILQDPKLKRKLSKQSKTAFTQLYDLETTTTQYEDLYSSFLS